MIKSTPVIALLVYRHREGAHVARIDYRGRRLRLYAGDVMDLYFALAMATRRLEREPNLSLDTVIKYAIGQSRMADCITVVDRQGDTR